MPSPARRLLAPPDLLRAGVAGKKGVYLVRIEAGVGGYRREVVRIVQVEDLGEVTPEEGVDHGPLRPGLPEAPKSATLTPYHPSENVSAQD
ncbi:MAG: hypothetical protein M3P49_07825 [Actinomycetota bacterium]|nr:hypothetical protein [Actinomycetota bacterium]